ncbi:hypothetical protein [Jannaschia ovalis]|uniref:Dihydroorotate dehydrogenase n=1 Tax=Jannaschia ovalis TaxID=3038773 RepID=A0ABY8LCM4_9RHOB|nr:hypothetical protein [Jannaschia sp. GRR-S6-38]WGH77909.1 hypothetical protein P8627_12815 [Jannaschia sp. GRR-S6-38]
MSDDIETRLAALRDAPAPMPRELRARILAEAARRPKPGSSAAPGPRWGLWSGLAGLPAAALAGLWLGLSQPALVWDALPGLTAPDAVLEDVFDTALLAEDAA